MTDTPKPITRKEQYMSYLTGNTDWYPKAPITREEQYLFYLCENGGIGGGTVTPEQIQQAVDSYLEENPVSVSLSQVSHGTSDTTYTLPANEYHTWDEVAALTITLASGESGKVNEYLFSFTSGDTPTTLSLPEAIRTDIVVESNTRYECSIVDNYMVFREWEVSE